MRPGSRDCRAQPARTPASAWVTWACLHMLIIIDGDDENLPGDPCAYRKSNPGILMMQPAQDWLADNTPGCNGGGWYRCILIQGQVTVRAVVVGHVRQQHVTQMAFAKHNDMINAFPADRADQPFCISVLPRRARRRRTISNADGSNPTNEYLAVGAIAVADQVTRDFS